MLKKCRKVWCIKNNTYICKVNKAQNKTQKDMNTITLNETQTALINGKQFILTGEYLFIGYVEKLTIGGLKGKIIVMDPQTNEIFILQ